MTSGGDDAALRAALAAIVATWRSGRRETLPAELEGYTELADFLDEVVAVYRFTLAISEGDLETYLAARGNLAGSLKNLHGGLRHLTWQTQRVAAGDFTQRVDFMGEFSEAFNTMVGTLGQAHLELAERNQRLQEQAKELEELATMDTLTRVYCRRKFDEVGQAELARESRFGHPLSLLIFDVDYFKRVNDAHGHAVGDEVLVALARLIGDNIRCTDSLVRWGGDEFIVLLPGAPRKEATRLAERLRVAAAACHHLSVGTVTVSMGVAQHRAEESLEELFARADEALYRAKDGGRNRIESSD